MTTAINKSLEQLEEARRYFGQSDEEISRVLTVLSKSTIADADKLIRFHEALLFFRAYPPNPLVLRKV